MATKKKNEENLPAKIEAGKFDLSVPGQDLSGFDVSTEMAAEMDDTDKEGYAELQNAFSIVSIRQKDLLADDGRTKLELAGGFKIYDPVLGADATVPDIPGDQGLLVTVLGDMDGRVYFAEGAGKGDQPLCRSMDNKTGVGAPGGHCLGCPLGQFTIGEDRSKVAPKCRQQMNSFVWDHISERAYVIRFGPSGLGPYNKFGLKLERIAAEKKQRIFKHNSLVKITTSYKAEPFAHFIPDFVPQSILALETFRELKALRIAYVENFKATAAILTGDEGVDLDPDKEVSAPVVDHEMPPDRNNKDQDDLPF